MSVQQNSQIVWYVPPGVISQSPTLAPLSAIQRPASIAAESLTRVCNSMRCRSVLYAAGIAIKVFLALAGPSASIQMVSSDPKPNYRTMLTARNACL